MHICVVGTGYVGLVTGACLADFGINVTCVDKDEEKIAKLLDGEIPIYEPGLDSLVEKNARSGRLHFSTDLAPAIQQALAIFIAVGTPPKEDGSADLSYVVQVAEAIADNLNGYKVVVTKSTVPIGTGQLIEKIITERESEAHPFSVVSNPEFLREGSAIADFMRPDRVVIGARDAQAVAIMKDIYSPLYLLETPFVITNVESSELIKYASNAFLATKITFINEVAELCDRLGADVHHVSRGMGLDKRIGPKFLHPGPGYGGSCFPKDTQAMSEIARKAGRPFEIVDTVIEVNNRIKERAVERVQEAIGEDFNGKTVAVLGLSFKPETDDMRDSSSIPLVTALVEGGAKVKAFDPVAMDNARGMLPEAVQYCEDSYDAAEGADAMIIVTEWNQFRSLDMERVRSSLKQPVVIDLRNLYDPKRMKDQGFRYSSVGRAAEDLPGE
ncbi:MAG: UDP-glucose/GDP-mannose dehydrogenase family protein [Acidobacteria bacterium]|uniref:UDP-glucose 6-dehydrogenase n=1 Tax=Candidatus Sulfomarinibacter kjeldsenii TaxID=2885994 RepID=A0A8J6XWH0_9BACT|nr:UDP-glucose/GDP-mannose dehydrogenase family protein [Candidatus Sulfomarinibacter kjeldsenii]MBD3870102.1 UDP-glucose/GDP-mannose dehydrogenase family protein [Candidatus Sulfomarinibacter kjeldsenii]